MSLVFNSITDTDVSSLMPIENACHSHPWSEPLFKSCISGRYFGQYLIFDETIIGFYIGEYVAGDATLMDICVKPYEQGNGYGKKLLMRFIEQATALGGEQVFLEVRASNIAAQMLYINQGFSETGRRTGYYPSAKGFGYEDAVVMKKNLLRK
jgi:ribosomal-protein-alanine N-acetyltransferase